MSIIPATAFPPDLLPTLFLTGEIPLSALQADSRFSYRAYVPDAHYPRDPTSTKRIPVLVAVHGTSRRLERHIAAWKEFADANGCVIVAPLFPALLQGPLDLDGYHYLGNPPPIDSDHMKSLSQHEVHINRANQTMNSAAEPQQQHQQDRAGIRHDLLLLSMLDEITLRWPAVDTAQFYLLGFSGGGQFSHRFLYLHPHRLLGVCVGAPGGATHLDFEKKWPHGVKGLDKIFGRGVDVEQVRRVPVLCVVGGNDLERPISKTRLRLKGRSFNSEEKGFKTRVEKTSDLADNLRAAGLDVKFEIVEGAAHEMEKCVAPMVEFMTGLMESKYNE